MLVLHAIYADTPGEVYEFELPGGRTPDKAFDDAIRVKSIFGRSLKAIWVVDQTLAHQRVTKYCGNHPADIPIVEGQSRSFQWGT